MSTPHERITDLEPVEQLVAFAELIKDLSDAMRREGVHTRAQHIVTTETNGERDRNG